MQELDLLIDLRLIFRKLEDEGQVFLFQIHKVLHQISWLLEWRSVLLFWVIFLKQWLKLIRVLDLVLSVLVDLRVTLRLGSIGHPSLCWNRSCRVRTASLTSNTLSLLRIGSIHHAKFLLSFGFSCSLHFLLFLRTQLIQKLFVGIICAQLLKFLVYLALKSRTCVIDLTKLSSLVIPFLLCWFKLARRLTCLVLNLGKEFQEALGIFFKHLLRALKTNLTHFVEVSQSVNLFVLLFE